MSKFLLFVLLVISGGYSTSCICANAEKQTVYDSIYSPNDYDSVFIPEDTAAYTERIVITKNIHIIGAGKTKTKLINNIPQATSTDQIFNLTFSDTCKIITVSHIEFDADSQGSCMYAGNTDNTPPDTFRVHNCAFRNGYELTNMDNYRAITIKNNSFGLIDSCDFYDNDYDFKIYGSNASSWVDYPGLENIGTKNYIYIENCTSVRAAKIIVASGEGARWVYRYNNVDMTGTDAGCDAHGDTQNWGVVAHEIYENDFPNSNDPVSGGGWGHDFRGGVGIIFNNRAQIGTGGVRSMVQVREEYSTYASGVPVGCYCIVNNSYIWNNRNTRNDSIIPVWESDAYECISENTSWWDDARRVPGLETPDTLNFTYDILYNRPSSPADGDCFWATDVRVLYRSVGDNNWVEVYRPYTYPHPLSGNIPPRRSVVKCTR